MIDYVIHGELTAYGDQREEYPIEVVAVTADPDYAELLAEMEASSYAYRQCSQWRRTSRNRWRAWEPGEFRYVVSIVEYEGEAVS